MTFIYRLLVVFAFASFFVACGNDDDGPGDGRCGENWSASVELQDELEDLTQAVQTYTNDPTKENCEAYRTAYLDYLDEVRDFEECYILVGQQAAFNQAVDNAEDAINALVCQ